jgi:hypothetical protein
MADGSNDSITLFLKLDRRQGADRRDAKRPGGRRASDVDAFAPGAETWPAGALELWPELVPSGPHHRVTVH